MIGEPIVHAEGVAQRFGARTIFRDVSLTVYHGEVFVILGGSGCGKSTLLRIVSGLERPTEGQVRLARRRVDGPTSDVAMVYSDCTRRSFIWPAALPTWRLRLAWIASTFAITPM